MQQLNSNQRRAIQHTEGALLVLAGAGSGKTGVITHKIAHLVRHDIVAPTQIAAITFTNKAAREMRDRVNALSKDVAAQIWISTFHTLGLRILRFNSSVVGLKPNFTIFDQRDCASLLADIARRELGTQQNQLNEMLSQISRWKDAFLTPHSVINGKNSDPNTQAAARCFGAYTSGLRAYNAVDFDDLITLPVALLRADEATREHWHKRIGYLLVDEYQDTSASQYELLKLLIGARGNLTVVGDDDQSIYSWRGAKPENLALLARDFAPLEVIKLEQNYRSTGIILDTANHLIAQNRHLFDKRLWCDRGPGERIRIVSAQDEYAEAALIADRIAHRRLISGARYCDHAVLFRSNHQARLFEQAFRERNIPYLLSGSRSFFDAGEVKDLVCYLRLACNPQDDNACLRIINVPRRGIGTQSVARVVEAAAKVDASILEALDQIDLGSRLSARVAKLAREFATWMKHIQQEKSGTAPHALLQQLIADVDYFDWLEQTAATPAEASRRQANVTTLLDWVRRLGRDRDKTLEDILAALTLFDITEREELETPQDCVALTTLHAAKGLQFQHVYIVGMEENLLPHHVSIDADQIEEERRLAYVGITRAQLSLTLSSARTRRRFGDVVECQPSRFIDELPREHLVFEGSDDHVDRDAGVRTLDSLREMLGK